MAAKGEVGNVKKFLVKFMWFIISKILFNLSIFKLKMVGSHWRYFLISFDLIMYEKSLSSMSVAAMGLAKMWPCCVNPSAQFLATEKPRGFFSFYTLCFHPTAHKPLCLLCQSFINVSAGLWTVRHVCNKYLDRQPHCKMAVCRPSYCSP